VPNGYFSLDKLVNFIYKLNPINSSENNLLTHEVLQMEVIRTSAVRYQWYKYVARTSFNCFFKA